METTNKTFNKIPDDCTISLDIRYIPEDKDNILNDIEKLKNEFDVEVIANEPALFVEEDNIFVKKIKESTEEVIKNSIKLY
jgi:succinyl-diaminopimelate desuccinylase